MVLSEVAVDIVAVEDEARFRDLMQAPHYLGAVPGMGETVRYVAHHRGRWLAVFSAPALKCGARDRWIGWDYGVQFGRLHLVTNNSRFLILPGGERNLGSRVLSLCALSGERLAGPLRPRPASGGDLRGPSVLPGHRLPRRQLDQGRTHPRLRPRRAQLQRARTPEACVPSSPVPGRAGPVAGRPSRPPPVTWSAQDDAERRTDAIPPRVLPGH